MTTPIRELSAFDALVMMGMVETNAQRLCSALDKLHDTLGRMDNQQLAVFRQTDLGTHCRLAANWYGQREMALRSDY